MATAICEAVETEAGNKKVLVVDLDGTLLKSDMLFETFWSACSTNWRGALKACTLLPKGIAAVKHSLAVTSDIDVKRLPYNQNVLDYVGKWRSAGGATALVTATSSLLADRIATHLAIFDEVHGSSPSLNLKGHAKASALHERFGTKSISYIGDSPADLKVWKQCSGIVAVNPARGLRSKINRFGLPTEYLEHERKYGRRLLHAMRPHQWAKNLLVFIPLAAVHSLELAQWAMNFIVFMAFCLVASSVYILNDLLDLNADRSHPRKRHRVLASGALPIQIATASFPILLASGIGLSTLAGLETTAVLIFYFICTLGYSLYFKRKILIDICVLAGLYTLRIAAGAAAFRIDPSVWLLAFSIFFFFSLASVKRQAELTMQKNFNAEYQTGRGYRPADLPILCQMGLTSGYIAILVLAMYINAPSTKILYSSPYFLWGICLVLLFWTSRMVFVTNRGRMHDDPLVFAMRDRVSRYCVAMMVIFTALGILL
jgi:4-hydroxybenzoate polyprenyltransferase/phosphoglycolate phosphatase-like HAD superfamily hydrolase